MGNNRLVEILLRMCNLLMADRYLLGQHIFPNREGCRRFLGNFKRKVAGNLLPVEEASITVQGKSLSLQLALMISPLAFFVPVTV
jgi:hypothetical protein